MLDGHAAERFAGRDEAPVALHPRDVLAWREAHPGKEPDIEMEDGGVFEVAGVALEVLAAQNPGMFRTSPVEQFVEHCWVAPFVEDDVSELAVHLPVERILFGSDWPHAEGLSQPKDFLSGLAGFTPQAQRRIMLDNARELTFG